MRFNRWKIIVLALSAAITISGLLPALVSAEPPLDLKDDTSYPKAIVRWKHDFDKNISSPPVVGSEGTIYVGTEEQKLYAIEADGSVKWELKLNAVPNKLALGPDGTIYAILYPNVSNVVYAIDPNGRKKWEYARGGLEVKTDYNKPFTSPVIGANGMIYVSGSNDKKLYAIEPDGTKKWDYPTGEWPHTPAIDKDGTIYVADDKGSLYAFTPKGALKWTYPANKYIVGAPVIAADGTVYVTTSANELHAVQPDGSKKWIVKGDMPPIYTYSQSAPVVGTDGTIYTGISEMLYAFTPDGMMKWKLKMKGMFYSNTYMAIGADDTIYVPANKALYAIDADGNIVWEFAAIANFDQLAPAIGNDGTVYTTSLNSLYALGTTAARSIRLDKSTLNLQTGSHEQLTATVIPEEATNKQVKWESRNSAVAAVDSMGTVTGVAQGTAKIIATAEDGGFIAECVVTVTPAPKPDPAPTPTPDPVPFTDIANHWAKTKIIEATKLKIANGYPDGTFRPNDSVTRAEFVVLLMKGIQPAVEGTMLTFTDQAKIGKWAVEAVSQAVQLGIVSGYPDGSFRPSATITHAEMIVMIVKASDLSVNKLVKPGFADDSDIPSWATGHAAAAKKAGITDFMQGNRFAPNAKTTRAEAVTGIVNMLGSK